MASKYDGLLIGGLAFFAGLAFLAANSEPQLSQQRVNELHTIMQAQVNRVAWALGIAPPRLQANWKINNADASGDLIRYNPRWLDKKLRDHCNDHACVIGVIVGVVAHETSHVIHTDRYTHSQAHNHGFELRADRVAGWVLAKLGHAKEDMQKVWREFVAMNHPTHPPAQLRIDAISHGFQRFHLGCSWA